MNIASMFELVRMLEDLDKRNENGSKMTVNDWVFCEDGKSIWVQLSNGNEYHFSM